MSDSDSLKAMALREIAVRNAEAEKLRKQEEAIIAKQAAKEAAINNCWYKISVFFGRHLHTMQTLNGSTLKWLVTYGEETKDYAILLYTDDPRKDNKTSPLARLSVDLDSFREVNYFYRDWLYHASESRTHEMNVACNFIKDSVVANISNEMLTILAKEM